MNEGKKNDRLDNKTRWELMPLDCLDDVAQVYTKGAEKYGDNNWQKLANGYERYKGALLRHLYAAENETFDSDTGCRHLAQVAWNAIAMLWISKWDNPYGEKITNPDAYASLQEALDNWEDLLKADSDCNEESLKSLYRLIDDVKSGGEHDAVMSDRIETLAPLGIKTEEDEDHAIYDEE